MSQGHPTTNDYFEVVIHDKGSFPFSNYERYLYRRIDPGKQIYMFTERSVTNHLHTFRNPCSDERIGLLNTNFSYDQTVCRWQKMCENVDDECRCSCERDALGISSSSCRRRCLNRFEAVIINTTICPQACHKTKYSDLNAVTMDSPSKNLSTLVIIMSNLVAIATEEPIYTMTRMFSEIGGLSSLLFGVSSIFIFELIEKILRSLSVLTLSPKRNRLRRYDNLISYQRSYLSESTEADSQVTSCYPLEVTLEGVTYSTYLNSDCDFIEALGLASY